MHRIKDTKDFVLGTISLATSLWLILDKTLITGFTLSHRTPFLGRPDVYVRMIALVWAVLSVLLILKSLNLSSKKAEKVKFEFNLPLVAFLPMVAFIIYALVLEQIGFFASSLILMMFLCCTFQIKEKHLKLSLTKDISKVAIISFVFSVLTVISLEKIFTHLLKVRLP